MSENPAGFRRNHKRERPKEDFIASAWLYTLIPATATVFGAAVATRYRPGPILISAVQHFAAGVVFAAAAGEILPDVMHGGSPLATVIGGALGLGLMLLIKQLEAMARGRLGLILTVGVDILVDGLVLGIAFVAGKSAGVLLTIALTIEVLFLGMTVATELKETIASRLRIVGIVALIVLALPLGAVMAGSVAALPGVFLTGFFAFALMALLYLVTEELLADAHETPDRPWVAAMFFVGFLMLITLEELMA